MKSYKVRGKLVSGLSEYSASMWSDLLSSDKYFISDRILIRYVFRDHECDISQMSLKTISSLLLICGEYLGKVRETQEFSYPANLFKILCSENITDEEYYGVLYNCLLEEI